MVGRVEVDYAEGGPIVLGRIQTTDSFHLAAPS